MPKKHQPKYTKQSYTQSSPAPRASAASSSSQSSSPATVNERLNQLRREQNPKATAERRDEVTLVASQRTVPPTLRSILNLPETAPIVPHRGLRQPAVRGRQVPGPAPPASWLERSRHARQPTPREKEDRDGELSGIQAGFKSLVKLPSRQSLAHYALRQMAADWEW